jgi:hypothetical protein
VENARALFQDLTDDRAAHLDGAAHALAAVESELGDDLAVLADEQDRAALGGHNLEDEAQQLALQLFGIADGVDARADLDEQRQVARECGQLRQLRLRTFGGRERVLDAHPHGRVGRQVTLAHLDGVRVSRRRLVRVAEEDEARLADADLVAVFEQVFADGLPVDEGSVEAVEVYELVARVLCADDAVAAREQRVGDADAV